jgi:hypothetical protein
LFHEISIIGDVTIKLYYEEFLKGGEHSLIKFNECMERAMDQVKKDHYFSFYKHLHVCDPNAPSSSLMDSTTSPKVKIADGEGVRVQSLARNILGVEGRARAPRWD